jgi:hypothetical protein
MSVLLNLPRFRRRGFRRYMTLAGSRVEEGVKGRTRKGSAKGTCCSLIRAILLAKVAIESACCATSSASCCK